MSEYPEFCASYYGIHSVECLNQIWMEEDCLLYSPHSPANASSVVRDEYAALPILYEVFKACAITKPIVNIFQRIPK